MNAYNKLHNSLIHRRLLPPPISAYKVNDRFPRSAKPALLHQAYASCGRVLSCLLCFLMGLLSLSLASCEKPLLHDEELEAYYEESLHLDLAPRDSVIRFSCKVQQYVSINPEATEDPLYPKIQEKIHLCLRLTDSSWGEDRTITFGGNATGDSNNVPDSGTVTSGSIVVDTAWAGHTYVHY